MRPPVACELCRKTNLVEVHLEWSSAHSVIGADQPLLEVAKGTIGEWHGRFCTSAELNEEAPSVVSGTIGADAAVDMMKRGVTDYVLKDRLSRLGPAVARALQVPAKSAACRWKSHWRQHYQLIAAAWAFLRETPSVLRRTVHVRAWRYAVRGVSGCVVPVYFLDTDVPENSEWDRGLTRSLYGGDWYMRLCQEVVLGVREYRCSVHSVTTKSSGFT